MLIFLTGLFDRTIAKDPIMAAIDAKTVALTCIFGLFYHINRFFFFSQHTYFMAVMEVRSFSVPDYTVL